jgi:spermidine synthase
MSQRTSSAILYVLFFLSGAAALGYQLIWSRMFAVGLGQEMSSVLAVVSAFMGGMSLGAWFIDRPIPFPPTQTLALIELTIGLWGIVTALLVQPANHLALHLSGLGVPTRQWIACFALPFLILLPATLAMGASFPTMERCISTLKTSKQTVPGVYAMNTFGAVAGIYLSIFAMAPALGFRRTIFCLAAINLACAIALSKLPRPVIAPDRNGGPYKDSAPSPLPFGQRRLIISLFVTGLLGIGVETITVRALSQVLENTVYSFAAVLAVFLVCIAVGAAIFQRLGRAPSARSLTALLCGLGLSLLLSIVLLYHGPAIYDWARSYPGTGKNAMIRAEVFLAFTTLALPCSFMGAIFSLLAQSVRDTRGTVGQAVAINTAGAAIAPVIFSLLILPGLGSKWALVLLSAGYFTLMPSLNKGALICIVFFGIALPFLPRDLHILDLPPQGKLWQYREGITASAAVVEDATKHKILRVNNHFQMGGTGAASAEYRHAHIPLLLHPSPRHVLVLGVGTGITVGGASTHPNLKIDGVELLPEVIDLMPQFAPFNRSPQNNGSVQIVTADARRFAALTKTRYDVIIADLFHPAADGAGNLYTLEQFRSVREHLAPRGLFCQWLPLHQLDLPMFKVITRTFLEVFPNTHAWLLRFNVDAPVVGLIGTLSSEKYPSNWIERRLAGDPVEPEIKKLALADSIRFFGNYLAAPNELIKYCGNVPLNTDDHPIVIFRTPDFAYQKNQLPYGRLLRLLNDLESNPAIINAPSGSAAQDEFIPRLKAYFNARKVYITGLVAEAEDHADQAIDAFVESARLSSDFTPGYAQCLTLAAVEARSNPTAARRLLERLIQAQPSQPVARETLNRLFPAK